MPENYAQFFSESGTDIDASKYVSKLLKRSVKQLPGSKEEKPEEKQKEAVSSKTEFAKLTKLLKQTTASLQTVFRIFLLDKRKSVPIGSKLSSRPEDKALLINEISRVADIKSILTDLNIEFLSKPQVSTLKKLLEDLYNSYSIFIQHLGDLHVTRVASEDFIKNLAEEIESIFPIAQALLDSEGIVIPRSKDKEEEEDEDDIDNYIEPEGKAEEKMEGGCFGCGSDYGGPMTIGSGYSSMPYKRFL